MQIEPRVTAVIFFLLLQVAAIAEAKREADGFSDPESLLPPMVCICKTGFLPGRVIRAFPAAMGTPFFDEQYLLYPVARIPQKP